MLWKAAPAAAFALLSSAVQESLGQMLMIWLAAFYSFMAQHGKQRLVLFIAKFLFTP